MVAGRVLRTTLRRQWKLVTAAALFAAGHQAGEALVTVVIGVVIDRAVSTGDVDSLLVWLAVLAAVFVVLSFSYRFAARTAERAALLAAHGVRLDLTRRVLDPRGGAEAGRLPGELVSVATTDAVRVGGIVEALAFGFAALSGLLTTAVALLAISVPLGLLVLLGAPPLLFLAHLLSRPLQRRSAVEQESVAHASGVAADLVAGLRVLKGIGAEPAAAARYRRVSGDSLAATLRSARAEAWQGGTTIAVNGLFIAAVALVGGRLAAEGRISVGGLVSAVGLALFLLGPLNIFGWVAADTAQARASAARVARVLAAPYAVGPGVPRQRDALAASAASAASGVPRVPGSPAAPGSPGVPGVPGVPGSPGVPVGGELRMRGVALDSLRGLDLDLRPGELLGVVAPDPADAAALVRCLAREVEPDAGVVSLNGVGMTTLDPVAGRTAVLVSAHEADLFEGTLEDNVATAAPSPEAVGPALDAAAADEVCEVLPEGARTALSERGRNLSGGQRQRVALARALAAAPPVLVLHEPTSAVDSVTEARIAHGIRDIRAGRGTVLVTTSPALLAATDRVVLVVEGRAVADGPHATLVRTDARYRSAVLG